ncbi:MAG: hypothetical protein WBZ40_13145 [Acidimicrobiia bacterium]
MEVGKDLTTRIARWDGLSRWERSELGKDLRRAGLSYGEIMGLVPVKKSTLATWCRDVRLTDEQYGAIKGRTGSQEGIPRDTQRKRHLEIEVIQRDALGAARQLMKDPLWLVGVSLYWGEGFKTQSQLGMANADPYVLRTFIRWATEFHNPQAGFRARLNIHADNDEPSARTWWADQLALPLDDFTKSFVKPDGTGHRKNHLHWGVCLVRMRQSADAFHTTTSWIKFLKKQVGLYD